MADGQLDLKDAETLRVLLSQNVLNDPPGQKIMWTRVNVGEAVPGTVTPLNADFHRKSNAAAPAQVFYRMGLQAKPETIDIGGAGLNAFLCGKIAINVDYLRHQMDRMPGTSGAQFEQSILGSVREDAVSTTDRSRYLVALAKILWLVKVLPEENRKLGENTQTWWRNSINRIPSTDKSEAFAIFDAARERYAEIIAHAGLVASFSPAILNQVAVPLTKVGTEEDLLIVASGYGNVKETAMLDELWQVARGETNRESFLEKYGYMCANAGELETSSWREVSDSLDQIIASNAAAQEEQRPARRLEAIVARSKQKRAELLAKADFGTRQQLKLGFWIARRLLPIREIGKACMFQGTDVGRAAARRIGALLVSEGHLSQPDDVFYLPLDNLAKVARGEPGDYKAIATANRALRKAYAALELPDFFLSEDLPVIVENQLAAAAQTLQAQTGSAAVSLVKGSPASAGTVTGRARIVLDPSQTGAFQPGDVLICKVTDPGWSALFSIAGALVADIGGMLSHSAIIARELGIPAVVGTKRGTQIIPDGALVRVDGAAGTVEILSPALGSTEPESTPA